MDIAILGAGALGSLFGGYLARAGQHVTLIGRENDHMRAIRAQGLKITGVRGEHVVTENLRAVWDATEVRSSDVLVVAVKANDTQQALASVSHLVGHVPTAFSLQNTLVKDELLVASFGKRVTLGASTIEGAALAAPGHVANPVTVPTTLYLGELGGEMSPRLAALVDAFNDAGLGTKAVPYIKQVQWEKLLQICLTNAFSVPALAGLPRASLQDVLAVREGAEQYATLARELLGVYRGLGYSPEDFFAPLSGFKELVGLDYEATVERLLARAEARLRNAKPGRPVRSSLFVDLERGRRTEVVQIFTPFLEEAMKQGTDASVLRNAYRNIRVVEALAVRDGGLCQR
jgi:2-dehydropantoate 2-reductase